MAAELIKQDVLVTIPELAHELKTHVEQCAARKGAKGFSVAQHHRGLLQDRHLWNGRTGPDASVVHPPKGQTSAKDLQEFVRRANYVLHGLRASDNPDEATMSQWFRRQAKRVPILARV